LQGARGTAEDYQLGMVGVAGSIPVAPAILLRPDFEGRAHPAKQAEKGSARLASPISLHPFLTHFGSTERGSRDVRSYDLGREERGRELDHRAALDRGRVIIAIAIAIERMLFPPTGVDGHRLGRCPSDGVKSTLPPMASRKKAMHPPFCF